MWHTVPLINFFQQKKKYILLVYIYLHRFIDFSFNLIFFLLLQAVQGKLFGSKEIVALSCAWCHEVYHNKESCFNPSKIGEECKLGKLMDRYTNMD